MITEPVLVSCLRRHWGLADATVTVHNGGMGSQTWFVDLGDRRWVAKAVAPQGGAGLAGGMAIAQRLDHAGIPAGAPVPAGVDPDADYLALRPWLRPAVTAALDALDAAGPDTMSWGLLHADPAPDAFRLDPATGRCGVIDWSYAVCGPLIYDLASAVMYVGRPDRARRLIAAYLEAGVAGAAEVRQGLAAMLRFRWAVQANYFAWRIAGNDLTGINGPQDNETGLEDARRALTS